MRSHSLIRLAGWATITGGLGFGVGNVAITILYPESLPLNWRFSFLGLSIIESLEVVFIILLLLGSIGIYIRQREASGMFGFLGFLFAFMGTAWSVGQRWASAFVFSGLSASVPETLYRLTLPPPIMATIGVYIGIILLPLGWVLFGLASLRAKVFPIWSWIFVLIGITVTPIIPVIGYVVSGIGWSWIGYSLVKSEI
jgi:hypothetical protein